jgi:hypothetical protein
MKNLFLLLLLSLPLFGSSQQLSVSYGRLLSYFDYEDSQGNSLDNLSGISSNSFMLGYQMPIASKRWYLNTAASYNKYGARGSDIPLDTYFEWDVNYLGINIGIDYEFLEQKNFFANQDGFYFYIKGSVATEFMVQGTQRINNKLYNLKGEEQFDKPVFFLRGGAGANYCVSHRLVVFLQYMGGKSLPIFGKSSGDREKLQYITHAFSFGLLLNLPQCKYCDRTF